MFEEVDEIDLQTTKTIKEQIEHLKGIASELITVDSSGNTVPKPGVKKEQMLYAIEQIRNIQSIYDERAEARLALNKEIDEGIKESEEVRDMAERMNKKYHLHEKNLPNWQWLMKVFRCRD